MFNKLKLIVLVGLFVTIGLSSPHYPHENDDEGDSDQDYNEDSYGEDDDNEDPEGNDDQDEEGKKEEGEDDMKIFKRQAPGCRALTNSCSIDRDCCSGFCFRGKPGNHVFGICK